MRDWKRLNNKYINEGYLYLSFDFLKTWKKELNHINKSKKGSPFLVPESLIRFYSVLRTIFGLPYRQGQGALQALQEWIPIPYVISYCQLQRRLNEIGYDIIDSLANPHDGQIIAIDSTGIKLYNSGEWIREKHNKKKPFLKLHIAVNIKSKQAVSLVVTEDSVTDDRKAMQLIEDAQKNGKIKAALLDGAYDKYDIWNGLYKQEIEPVIRLRKNAISNGLNVRARAVRERDKIGQKQWAKKHKYGQRWQSEAWFSAYKRRFGEHCRAVKPENVIREIMLKASICNMLIA
jgi:hypothetical protein